jgi:hypothetical protein
VVTDNAEAWASTSTQTHAVKMVLRQTQRRELLPAIDGTRWQNVHFKADYASRNENVTN